MSLTHLAGLVLASLTAAAVGCVGVHEDSAARHSAYELFGKANEAFATNDYATAGGLFGQAIEQGTLDPDFYSEAAVKRAVCLGAEGKYDEAITLLDKLAAGAPNLDQVFAARAFVLKKQGKGAEANAAMAQARRHNRTIKEFK